MITFRQFLIVLFGTAFGSAQFALPSFQAVSSKDNNKPIITITATDGSNAVTNNSITNDATLTVTFTANESVTGFAIGDIGTFGGSVSSFSGSGSSYTATFTPSSARNTGIYLVKDVYTDASSNNNLASLPFYWRYDASAPTIIAGTTVASNNSTITVKLSEQVYDTNSGTGALEVGDFAFSISGGAATLASSTPTSISKANPSFTARTIGTPNGPVEITYYDLDLDNDIDIIVPLNPGLKLIWYENNGSQSFTENTIDASVSSPREIWPVDLDLDGDIDLVVPIEGGDELAWYENDGSQGFIKRSIDTGNNGRAVAVADIDGDNDLDITFTTYSSNTFSWYENDGLQNFTKNSINSFNVRDPVIIDLDEDGDIDFVSEIDDGNDKIVWYENDGSQSFTQNPIDDIDGGHLDVVDLDEDGDYDLVFAEYYNHLLLWYENDGSENFTKRTIDDSGVTNIWDVEAGDIDGDGDIDIVGLTSTNNNTADDKIIWYANNGSESFTEYTIDTDLNHPYRLRLKDIDGDEDLDIVAGSRGGDQVIWYENVDAGYVLGLSLSGTPNGSETVTVSPVSSAIFDVAGNAASSSQSNNTVSLNAVVTNYVLDLNGSNEAAYVADDPAFETTDFSIQAWVDPSSLPSSGNQAWFVNKNRVYRMGLDNNGGTTKIFAQHRSGGTYTDIQGSTLSDASGGWYHVVFTFDDSSNRLRLYINGSRVAQESYSGSTVNQNSEFSIGRRHDTNGGYYHGKIDEVAYWNTELDADAITALYNSGTPLSASSNSGNYDNSGNLVMYYKFEENLNDSEGSFTLTGRNIGSSDYVGETIE